MMLDVRALSGGYGRTAQVLHGVSMEIRSGEIVALLGRNGVGKTTTVRALMGVLARSGGEILLDGTQLGGLPTYKRARMGLGYVPQGRDLFPSCTVEQNVRYGLSLAGRRMAEPLPEWVFDMFPWMHDRRQQRAGTLSGGQQQMVAIARVLVGQPRCLFLDEPTEGLAPVIVEQIGNVIERVAGDTGPGILLVEQNVRFALGLATRGYVMEKGAVVAEGSSDEIGSDEVVHRWLSI